MTGLREIAIFYDPEEAYIAAGYMRANGFNVALADKFMLMVSPNYRVALGGFRMMIAPHLCEDAQKPLESVRFQANQPASPCPLCEGTDYRRVKTLWFAIVLFLISGSVVPFAKNSNYLECKQCKTHVNRNYIDGSEGR